MITLIRHAEPLDKDKILGQLDPPLVSSIRHRQLQSCSFLDRTQDCIGVSSPLGRAIETAHLFGCEEPVIDDRIQEMDLGEYQGQPVSREVLTDINQLDLNPDSKHHNGETFNDFFHRVKAFFDEYVECDKHVVVFTHAGVIRVIMTKILEVKPKNWSPQYMEMIIIDPCNQEYEISQEQIVISRS